VNDVASIDTPALKELIDQGEVRVIEVLMPDEYDRGHIPGAIHIHFAMITRAARERLDQQETIVTYCHNERCRASRIAASKLYDLGYRKVFHYPGGKDAWVAAGHALEVSSD
jgi:rhodanese-related sulfurtransferase